MIEIKSKSAFLFLSLPCLWLKSTILNNVIMIYINKRTKI